MFTSGQWKDLRRVDHVKFIGFSFSRGVYLANPRWRRFDANHRPDLKVFDPFVDQANQAQNGFDRMTALARIIDTGYHLIQNRQAAGHAGDRYSNAVDALHNRAVLDMNQIVGAHYQQAMEDYITGVNRPARTIRINRLLIKPNAGAVSAVDAAAIGQQIQSANAAAAFQGAQIDVATVGAITRIHQDANNQPFLLGPAAPLALQGSFQDSAVGGERLIDYCNSLQHDADMDVVFLDAFDQSDVQGRTFRALNSYNGHAPRRPIVAVRLTPVAGGAATHPTTLLHELGHALCSEPSHSLAPDNLMAGGAIRSGVDQLSPGQMAWFCNNPYVS